MTKTPAQNLACPLDGNPFIYTEKNLSCPNGHSFDFARQGYINLLPVQDKRSTSPGDSPEMVTARTEFLNSGTYEKVSDKINSIAQTVLKNSSRNINILDAGCGEGYYLSRFLNEVKKNPAQNYSLIGMDISKPAILAATKRNRQDITWIVGTNRKPPIQPKSIDLILSIFGFPTYDTFKQILKPNGHVLLADSGPNHLRELREIIYKDSRKDAPPTLEEAQNNDFTLIEEQTLTLKTAPLQNTQIKNLLSMTPHFFRITQDKRREIQKIEKLTITIEIVFRLLKSE